jgi:hypothetical protein
VLNFIDARFITPLPSMTGHEVADPTSPRPSNKMGEFGAWCSSVTNGVADAEGHSASQWGAWLSNGGPHQMCFPKDHPRGGHCGGVTPKVAAARKTRAPHRRSHTVSRARLSRNTRGDFCCVLVPVAGSSATVCAGACDGVHHRVRFEANLVKNPHF